MCRFALAYWLVFVSILTSDALATCRDDSQAPVWTAVPDSTVADRKRYVAILLEDDDVYAGFLAYHLVQSLPQGKAWDVRIHDSDLVFLYSQCGSFQERAVSKVIIATPRSPRRKSPRRIPVSKDGSA